VVPGPKLTGPERLSVPTPSSYALTPAIKAWRPPVPEPLPPAPLLGPKGLLGLGALVLLQVWGWLNGRPKASVEIPPHTGTTITGTVPPSGNTVGASLTIVQPAGTKTIYGFDCQNPTTSSAIAQSVTLTNVKGVSFLKKGSKCGGVPTQLVWVIEHTDYRGTNERNILLAGNGIVSFNAGFQLTWNHPSAVPYEPDVEALPLPDGFVVPQVEPTADPDELSPPPPLPLPAPSTVPQVEPEVQPEVAPVETETETIKVPQIVCIEDVVPGRAFYDICRLRFQHPWLERVMEICCPGGEQQVTAEGLQIAGVRGLAQLWLDAGSWRGRTGIITPRTAADARALHGALAGLGIPASRPSAQQGWLELAPGPAQELMALLRPHVHRSMRHALHPGSCHGLALLNSRGLA